MTGSSRGRGALKGAGLGRAAVSYEGGGSAGASAYFVSTILECQWIEGNQRVSRHYGLVASFTRNKSAVLSSHTYGCLSPQTVGSGIT